MTRAWQTLAMVILLAGDLQPRLVSKWPYEVPPISKRGFYLHINMDKPTFKRYEDIRVICWLENTTDKSQCYNSWDKLNFELFEESGRPVESCLPNIEYSIVQRVDKWGKPINNYVEVAPHESEMADTFNLLASYGFGHTWECFYLPVGKYLLTCSKTLSDRVFFEVVEPTDSLEARAVCLMDRALDQHLTVPGHEATGPYFWPNQVQRYRFLAELVDSFPHVYFIPWANMYLHRSAGYLIDSPQWKDSVTDADRESLRRHGYDPTPSQ